VNSRASSRVSIVLGVTLSLITTAIPVRASALQAPASTAHPQATATVTSEPRDPFTLDTATLSEDSRDDIARHVRNGANRALRLYEEYAKKPLPDTTAIDVEVVLLDGDATGYKVTIDGKTHPDAPAQPVTFECRLCTQTELVDRTIEEIGLYLPKLAQTQTAATPSGAKSIKSSSDVPPEDKTGDRNKLSGLGYAGIASLVLGAAAVGVGGGLAAKPDELVGEQPNPTHRSTHIPGWTLVGVGSTLVIMGIILVAIDASRARKAAKRRAVLVPGFHGSGASLDLILRF